VADREGEEVSERELGGTLPARGQVQDEDRRKRYQVGADARHRE
jgi:hypothetical protein